MPDVTIDGDVLVNGPLIILGNSVTLPSGALLSGPTGFFLREQVAQDSLSVHNIPLTEMRVHDNYSSLIPGAATGDDLGLTDSNWTGSGTAHYLLSSAANNAAITQYAAFMYPMPPNFVRRGDLQLSVRADLNTTPAVSATLLVEAYESGPNGFFGSNLVAGDTQIPQTSVTDHVFRLNSADLGPGALLSFRIEVALDDTGGANASTLSIFSVKMMFDVKG